MESKKLESLSKKMKSKESKRGLRYNFGSVGKGTFTTSTSGSKAHVHNKLIRDSERMRDKNFQSMLEAYERGEVSKQGKIKRSKGFKRNQYKKECALSLKTIGLIQSITMVLSENTIDKTRTLIIV